ncbi:MAG TPA: hypothetical protein VFS35_04850 [Terrimicrobiaceae bacterium]|nr:hypothetical protein [Terrimicrobiaceae bacterium]
MNAQIAEHNRSCWIAAVLSLWCAVLAWALAGAVYRGPVVLVEALCGGKPAELPIWFLPVGLCAVVALLVAGLINRRRECFNPVSDRSILGWHLIAEVLLVPARATLLVWDHVAARIVLSRAERAETWALMRTILGLKRADRSLLARDFPDPGRLSKMLLALQFAGWIDLHRGEEDFYYRVRSDRERDIRFLIAELERS